MKKLKEDELAYIPRKPFEFTTTELALKRKAVNQFIEEFYPNIRKDRVETLTTFVFTMYANHHRLYSAKGLSESFKIPLRTVYRYLLDYSLLFEQVKIPGKKEIHYGIYANQRKKIDNIYREYKQ